MSFYDDASLIVYPSGYKESKIYAQKPTNGTGDLTFSRASSATRVNAEGLIEEASVIGSELITNGDFATDLSGWTNTGGIIWNAGKAEYTGATGNFYQGILTVGKLYLITFDWTRTSGDLRVYVGGAPQASTISTGTSGSFEIQAPALSDANINLYSYGFTGSIDNVSVKEVITSNVPRIDYSNGCGSLLLEKQSTNLITYSEDFSNASWLNTEGVTITANNTTSPDGTTNADKITPQATSNYHRLKQSLTVTASTPYTFSCFVKKAEYDYFMIRTSDTQNNNVGFNLLNGTITYQASGYSGFIEAYSNGWYRIGYVRTFDATSIQIGMRSQPTEQTDNNIATFTGDGTSGAYIYGAQFEESSYPTSYIISNSGTSTTRLADTASKTGISSLINDSEGVLFADVKAFTNGGTSRRISIGGGSTDNRVSIEIDEDANRIKGFMSSGGTTVGSLSFIGIDQTDNLKIALTYTDSYFSLFINGVKRDNDTSIAGTPIGLDRLFYSSAAGSLPFQGNCQNLMVFPSALTDDELADLTGAVHQTFNSLATFYGYTIL